MVVNSAALSAVPKAAAMVGTKVAQMGVRKVANLADLMAES